MMWDGFIHIHIPALIVMGLYSLVMFMLGLSAEDDVEWGPLWWLVAIFATAFFGFIVYDALVQAAAGPVEVW